MTVPFKKILKQNPADRKKPPLYHPVLVTLGKPVTLEKIAAQIRNVSSLSRGDIHSVLDNFIEATRNELYNGHSVNINNFGVFFLSARTWGVADRTKCGPKNIRDVRINFRPSVSVRPSLVATRAEDKLEFEDVEKMNLPSEGSTDEKPGGNENPSENPGEGEARDPLL